MTVSARSPRFLQLWRVVNFHQFPALALSFVVRTLLTFSVGKQLASAIVCGVNGVLCTVYNIGQKGLMPP